MNMKKRLYALLTAGLLLITMIGATGCNGLSLFNFTQKVSSRTQLYDTIVSCMQKNQTECSFIYTGSDMNEVLDTDTILKSAPGLSSLKYEVTSGYSGDTVKLTMTYWDSDAIVYAYRNSNASYLTERQKVMYDKYISIMNLCTSPDKSVYQNEKAIYNYLIDNITYDATITSHFNAYEALTEGRALCGGYSECFRTLMELIGYKCIAITGVAGMDNHMWNAVCIDNEWYQVDVTWGDTDDGDISPVRVYAYFNISDKEMSIDHERTSILPDGYANGSRYSYTVYENIPTIGNQAELNTYVIRSAEAKDTSIEFISNKELNVKSAMALCNVNCTYSVGTVEKEGTFYYTINCIYF